MDEQLSTINDTLVYVIGLLQMMKADQENLENKGDYFDGMQDAIDLLKDIKKNY